MINLKSNLFFSIILPVAFFCYPANSHSQSVKLQGEIFEYATYYVSNFDIQTGTSDVQLFRYRLYEENGEYPIWVKLRFSASMLSPSLGINTPFIIVELETNLFQLQADLFIDNRDISTSTTTLYDLANPPNAIIITARLLEKIDTAQFDALLSSVFTTGKLADGEYTFEVEVESGRLPTNLSLSDHDSRTFVVQTPSTINLESPGGALTDTNQNVIYTNYPVFNWYSQPCVGCELFIRLAEFIPGVHSTVEDAIEDETSLPFDQQLGWEHVDNLNTYQYPLSGAYPLEFGKIYVWQMKQSMLTTAGTEDLLSEIYAFKIMDMSSTPGTTVELGPLLQALQQAIGDDQFIALFGAGNDLDGFTPTGYYTINGVTVDESTVFYVINQIINGDRTITTIEVED